jgi:hypothetical protein
MKYSILGFNQRKVVELSEEYGVKIDCNDLLILSWFTNFRGTGKMKMKLVDEIPFYWVDYKAIITDLPILGVKESMMRKRFQKYIDIGFFDRNSEKVQGGTKTYYALNDLYFELIQESAKKSLQRENITSAQGENITSDRGNLLPPQGENITSVYNKSHYNDPSTNNPPMSPDGIDGFFEMFWKAYPKKINKQGAKKSFAKIKVDEQLFNLMLKAIEREKNSEQWKREQGRFIPHPTTWLNQRRWEAEIESINDYHSVNGQYVYGGVTGGDKDGDSL